MVARAESVAKFDAADEAREATAEPVRESFGLKETKPLLTDVEALPDKPYSPDGGSTDVGDNSTCDQRYEHSLRRGGTPGHSWQNVAAIGSPSATRE